MGYSRDANLVSIVIPAYNSASYIGECIDSLLTQTYADIELVVVDDGSTDETGIIMQRYRSDHRVLYVRLPRNVGFSGAVTTGLFMTKGEFIAMQDSDDISHPKRIEKQVRFLREHPNVDLVGTNYATFPTGDFGNQEVANWIGYGGDIEKIYRSGGHCVCYGTILFRAYWFDRCGGMTRRVDGAEDYEFIVKFFAQGARIENIPKVLYYYRDHPLQRSKEFYQ
ncbi:glycosyltransferase family 2 protein [Alicyclobacillus dauci]|uniref:Glycosyltransferase n=1 Tax=Alicyclobacillus dauci TaxID=1475485 RepID=A0ABY6ZBG1_9BACL|nr:glycosyltransferase family 2 protein [Alicyclobacillus dauci]WAH39461.1 glycosyltransferase [Alicyclobacillus dauci]